LTKTPLIYSVSRLNLDGLGALFGGPKSTKALRGDGTLRSTFPMGKAEYERNVC